MTSTLDHHDPVAAVVHDVVATALPFVPAAGIRGDRDLRQLGADSVDRVEIILTLLDRLGLVLPLSDFNDLRDLDELVGLLQDALDPVGG
jgi:polyketide biosynthesis acyl carrier protein